VKTNLENEKIKLWRKMKTNQRWSKSKSNKDQMILTVKVLMMVLETKLITSVTYKRVKSITPSLRIQPQL